MKKRCSVGADFWISPIFGLGRFRISPMFGFQAFFLKPGTPLTRSASSRAFECCVRGVWRRYWCRLMKVFLFRSIFCKNRSVSIPASDTEHDFFHFTSRSMSVKTETKIEMLALATSIFFSRARMGDTANFGDLRIQRSPNSASAEFGSPLKSRVIKSKSLKRNFKLMGSEQHGKSALDLV